MKVLSQGDHYSQPLGKAESTTASVVIVTFNSENTIGPCLESIERQLITPNEIILVDGGSSDNTLGVIRAIKERSELHISVLVAERETRGFCRNLGLTHCSSEIVCFLDSDCKAPDGWLSNIIESFRESDSEIAGVGGPYVPPEGSPSFSKLTYQLLGLLTGKLTSQFLRRDDASRLVTALPGGNCAFSRSIVQKIDGFDAKMDICEDTEISTRLTSSGYKLKFTPSLFVYHDWKGWSGLRQLSSAAANYGKGRVLASLSKSSLFPYGFALLLLLLTLGGIIELSLVIYSLNYLILPVFTVAIYLAFCSVLMVRHKTFSTKALLSPVVFLVSYGMGIVKGVLEYK